MKMKNNDSNLLAEAYQVIYEDDQSSVLKKAIVGALRNDTTTARLGAEYVRNQIYGKESTPQMEGASLLGKVLEIIAEAKKKGVSYKTNVNPWAVEKSVEKKTGKKFSPSKKEKIVKGIKKGAKKSGKKITSKPIKKSN